MGVYFSDTLDLTRELTLTVGGRYNFARLTSGQHRHRLPEVDGDHVYERFNPMGGLPTDQRRPALYGSYAEANRAPTPAELACSDPITRA